ncbi:MAG: D-alanyl-D-alanine carboxypeptidase family protein, partial [Clostridia bacterium]|nr:D-alanyl-D-alanine carboxypeptidase family protein [Clostridia bacterium]
NNNNNKNTENEKSIEELFCELYEENEPAYSYEQEREAGYDRSASMRMAKYRKKRIKKTVLLSVVIVLLAGLWLMAAFAIVSYVNGTDTPSTDTEQVTDAVVTDGEADGTDETPDTDKDAPQGYVDKLMPAGAHKIGELILINSTYTYDQTKDTYLTKELVSVWEYARENLSVSQQIDMLRIDTVKAINEMCIAFKAETGLSGYSFRPDYGFCTKADQQKWYDATVAKHPTNADAYEFKGGESEHETGRAFDLKVEENGAGVPIRNADAQYLWIYDNCYKYGIIYRYPSNKTEITGVSMSASSTHADHFRYVGVAAATAMQKNGWCLEQFIAEMNNYTYDGEHLKVEAHDGVKYEMYFYPANAEGETQVKVPDGAEYSISGNNIDGFIVTVTVK